MYLPSEFRWSRFADYSLRLVWLLYFLFASDYILLTDVQRELHRVPSSPFLPDDGVAPGSVTPLIEDMSTSRRLKWAADLFTSTRGVNWAHEPRSAISPHPDPPIPRITFIMRQLLKIVLIFFVYDLASLYMRSRAAFEPGVGTGIATLDLLGILCVVVHLTGPDEWPAFFGGPLTTHARRLTSALNLPPGAASTRLLQLFAIFFLSGLMHYIAEAAVMRT
ncbi:hypothetical protein DFH09DRAFT_1305124 [Mycena vulgaris]|nr:hypothetical protein DFH09DRAFT_1305124 [Mycena vulgaris]